MSKLDNFFSLVPEKIFQAAEESLDLVARGSRPTGVLYPLNSIENRVYEIPLEDNSSIVGKFYRPERWTRAQIQEEHSVLNYLNQNEIPVVNVLTFDGATQNKSDLSFEQGQTVGLMEENIFFCFFPKIQGRSKDELQTLDIEMLARFMARMHKALKGIPLPKSRRLELSTENYFDRALEFLAEKEFLPEPFLTRINTLVNAIKMWGETRLSRYPKQRVHGDCHWGNLLWFQGQPIFLDFDDMVVGPVVQDLWMMVGGRQQEDLRKRELFIENYNMFSEFPEEQWEISEMLRAMRIVHYSYWIAKRWSDPSFPKMFPHFGTPQWWNEEIIALSEIHEILTQS